MTPEWQWFEDAPVGTALVDLQGRWHRVNRALRELVGCPEEQLAGLSFQNLTHPDDRAAELGLLRSLLDGQAERGTVEQRYLTAAGDVLWVTLSMAPVRDEAGATHHLLAQVQDITQARAALDTAHEQQRLLEESQAAAGIGSWEWDIDGSAIRWSAERYRQHGLDPASKPPDVDGYLQLVHPEDRDALRASFVDSLTETGDFAHEYRIIHPTRGIRTLTVKGRRLPPDPATGLGARVVGTAQDVTEQRTMEAAQRQLELRYRLLLSNLPDTMVCLYDRDLTCLLLDGPVITRAGLDPASYQGRPITETLPASQVTQLEPLIRKALAGETSSAEYVSETTGFIYTVDVAPYRLQDGTIAGAFAVGRDVTAAKAREQEIRRLATVVEQSDDAIIVVADGLVTHWNAGAERLLGYPAEEILGQPVTTFGPTDRHDEMRELFARALDGEASQRETTRLRRDGSLIEVSVTVSPVRSSDGTVTAVSGIMRDLTETRRLHRELQALFDNIPAPIALRDRDGRVRHANPELARALGMRVDDIVGRLPDELNADAAAQLQGDDDVVETGRTIVRELLLTTSDGAHRDLHVVSYPVFDAAGAVAGFGSVSLDITERKRQERRAREAEESFRRVFDDAPIGMAVLDPDGRIQQANAALCLLTERDPSALSALPFERLLHPADRRRVRGEFRELGSGGVTQLQTELRVVPATGASLDVSVHATLLRDGSGQAAHVLLQCLDITERKTFESQLQFLADHDPLTGLLNRRKFESELARHVAHVSRYGAEGALIVLDLDHFKQVNDTLGHNAGDELISSVASVLRDRLRDSDILARIGGDEFAVLLPRADRADATSVAQDLVEAVRRATTLLDGEHKHVTTSVGVAMFDTDQDASGETILVDADLAMYDAKEAGRNTFAFADASEVRENRTKARLTWVDRIQRALEHDRFALVAQPLLDLRTRGISRHELLVRMLDDSGDLVPPAAFLAIAERYGLISRIDAWVAARAVALIAANPGLRLSVNISGKSLADNDLLAAIERDITESRIEPSDLVFEITETAAVANMAQAQTFAQRLRDLGCRFALDDFGAGFGSFYYLKHLPFDYVKIDGEFVQHLATGHVDRLIVQAVVGIARGLGKETVAEFVIDEHTERIVQQLGVDHAQGYHIGKPRPLGELGWALAQPPARGVTREA